MEMSGSSEECESVAGTQQNFKELFKALAAKELNHLHRVNIWYKVLGLLRIVGNEPICMGGVNCQSLLPRLLVSISLSDEVSEGVDLFASVFAYCSVNESLQVLIFQFIRTLDEDSAVRALFQKLCSLHVSDDDEVPGVYDVVYQLDAFETLDVEVLKFLSLNLGHVLVHSWIPSWKTWVASFRNNLKEFDTVHFLAKERILIKIVQPHELDLAIVNFQSYPKRWEVLCTNNMDAVKYFASKCAKRSLKHFKWLNKSFHESVITLHSKCIGNDSFKHGLYDTEEFHFQVIMEIIDHPELNLLEESHLLLLLRVTLGDIHEKSIVTNQIPQLHYTLGKLGTTLSFSSLINLLQYILSRYFLAVTECIQNGTNMETNLHWYKQLTNLSIPAWFDDFMPRIPPIARAIFGFDGSATETGQETDSFHENFETLFECLQLTLSLNEELLMFYGKAGIDPLDVNPILTTKNCSNVLKKTTSLHFTMYFVSIYTVQLLSQQLLKDVNTSRSILGPRKIRIGATRLFRHCVGLIEHIIDNHGNNGLYHFIKFASQVSIESLPLQEISRILLYHVFSETNDTWVLQLCLSNELSINGLLDYILLWNDGSGMYNPFFTKIFKQPQPNVSRKNVMLGDLIELLTERVKGPDVDIFPPSKPKSKFNTNATSFIPLESNTNLRTPKRVEHTPQYPIDASPNAYAFNTVSVEQRPSISSNMSAPFANYFTKIFTDDQQSRPQMTQNSSASPSVSSYGHGNSSKLVNTGKTYILGGHNRAVNNSRTKSVHVDEFEQF
ncbi:unnamed protein product [Kluyveromyces dobzhanskii CBS 2104]|uniref:WGS project CCBQ000000000 data, contig 00058 n=1 Tax=Kluyveromyces dobzhanskii CBS 2104 TaxID=1427455 RepID=A0A0A8LBU4_9SACH|nr:unnamed protein product [Kluyveromyces dobzhanskii CBS 2104]